MARLRIPATPRDYRKGDPMTLDLHSLEAIAKAAAVMSSSCRAERDDFEFIARASPHATLALLARIRELEAGLVVACDGWADRDSDGFDIDERNALHALAGEGKT